MSAHWRAFLPSKLSFTFRRSRLNQRSRRRATKDEPGSSSYGYSVNSPITNLYRVAKANIISVRKQYALPAASVDDSSFHYRSTAHGMPVKLTTGSDG